MEQPERRESASMQAPGGEERLIDKMVEQTFPASDATQLPGRAAGPPTDPDTSAQTDDDVSGDKVPRTIGNQGVLPASRELEQIVPLDEAGEVLLRFDGDLRRLQVFLSRDGMTLDAKALDRLIAALSAKRAQMAH
jgi:hypothetical protein